MVYVHEICLRYDKHFLITERSLLVPVKVKGVYTIRHFTCAKNVIAHPVILIL